MLEWCCGKPLNDWDELQCSDPGYITRCEVCGCWYIVYANGTVERREAASELHALPLVVAGDAPTQLPT